MSLANKTVQQANDVTSVVRTQIIAGKDPSDIATIIAVDANGRILTSTVISPASSVLEFGESTSIANGVLTTVLSFTNSLSTNALMDSIIVTGSVGVEFHLVIDGSTKGKFRTSEQDRTKVIPLNSFILAPSSILSVKIIHFETNILADLTVTLAGHRT